MTEKTKKSIVSLFYGAIIVFVIAILSFPMFGRVTPKARIANAKASTRDLYAAIHFYIEEGNQFPESFDENPIRSDAVLLDLLEYYYNGRKLDSKPTRPGYGGVFTNPDGSKELFDPWGNHYRVVIDTDGDEKITPPPWRKSTSPLSQSIIVWSPGPDGEDETADDNVTSWNEETAQ